MCCRMQTYSQCIRVSYMCVFCGGYHFCVKLRVDKSQCILMHIWCPSKYHRHTRAQTHTHTHRQERTHTRNSPDCLPSMPLVAPNILGALVCFSEVSSGNQHGAPACERVNPPSRTWALWLGETWNCLKLGGAPTQKRQTDARFVTQNGGGAYDSPKGLSGVPC